MLRGLLHTVVYTGPVATVLTVGLILAIRRYRDEPRVARPCIAGFGLQLFAMLAIQPLDFVLPYGIYVVLFYVFYLTLQTAGTALVVVALWRRCVSPQSAMAQETRARN